MDRNRTKLHSLNRYRHKRPDYDLLAKKYSYLSP